MEFGFFLSSEEHGPNDLIAFAQAAETAGFRSVLISDHYHPWLEEQGQSPFCLVRDRRRGCDDTATCHHWCHVPDSAHSSRRDRTGSGDVRRHDARALPLRRWQR